MSPPTPREVVVAWMRTMGADSVGYPETNVAGGADDHARAALAYYGSSGETPLRWGGSGAARLGSEFRVMPTRWRTRRCSPRVRPYCPAPGPAGVDSPPGVELVVSPHKSVAKLGVIGRAEDMHAIVDAERDATLAHLDGVCREMGGRRGEASTPAATGGLVGPRPGM